MEQSRLDDAQESMVHVRPLDDTYRRWVQQLLDREWGSCTVVSRGRAHDVLQLPAFVATRAERPIGLVTYCIRGRQCELVTLNSLVPRIGVGTALVKSVRKAAEAAHCWRLWLITTNDNVSALRFYQQRGFSLAALHRNAVNDSRRLKPEIPLTGMDEIPIQDEIELEIVLEREMAPNIVGIHHAMVTIPPGEEEAGRHFYCTILGLAEEEKPESLKSRGGFWVKVGDRDLHVGTEPNVDRLATKSHLAYQATNLNSWRDRLYQNGIEINESVPIPGFDRFEFRDPFGNRIEFIERQ
jgi:catechol 2,3-dioxygenase-like lactoylglutathione lyase family enzyme